MVYHGVGRYRPAVDFVCGQAEKRRDVMYQSALSNYLPRLSSFDNLTAVKDHIFARYSFIHDQNTSLSTHT